MIITIDGPAASGKSSVARAVAHQLGVFHFSTGFLYRAVAYILIQGLCGIKFENHGTDLANIDFNFISEINCVMKNHEAHVFFKDRDITPFLSDDQLSSPASALSSLPEVRGRLLDVQRTVGRQYDIVVDGRDCGSVVYPDADFKFFLTASVDARVKRIMRDPNRVALYKSEHDAHEHMLQRDQRDSKRAIAPLIVPEGAIVIDSSDLTLEQTIDVLLGYIN